MIRIGIIGYGYWGPNLVRNFMNVEGCAVTHVCDLDIKKLDVSKKNILQLILQILLIMYLKIQKLMLL